jgi:hypothetical protein
MVKDNGLAETLITPVRQVVSVERRGQAIVVQPPCAEVFAVLRTMKHVYASRHGVGGRTVKITGDLFKVENEFGKPQTILAAGMESVALHLLDSAGFEVTYSVETLLPPRIIPAPDVAAARRLGPVDRAMLKFVHAHDRGLVRFKAGAVRPARLIAQIALAFRDMKIAVALKRRADVRRLGRLLRKYHLPGMVDVVVGPAPTRLKHLVVTSFLGLAEAGVEIEKRDILIVPNAAEALEANARFAIPHAERARLYGFLKIGRKLAPYDRDWLAALFGVEDIVIPRHGHIERPVEVVEVKCAGGQRLSADTGIVSIKRQALWQHGLRNRRLAALARALVDGDYKRLDAESPVVAARLAGRGSSLKVALLVENVEHALALAERLPG